MIKICSIFLLLLDFKLRFFTPAAGVQIPLCTHPSVTALADDTKFARLEFGAYYFAIPMLAFYEIVKLNSRKNCSWIPGLRSIQDCFSKFSVDLCQATFQCFSPKNRGSSAAHTGPTVTGRPLCSARLSRIGAAKPGRKRVDSGAILSAFSRISNCKTRSAVRVS